MKNLKNQIRLSGFGLGSDIDVGVAELVSRCFVGISLNMEEVKSNILREYHDQ